MLLASAPVLAQESPVASNPLGPALSALRTPHGELLVVLQSGRVEFIDPASGASRGTFRPTRAASRGAAVSPDFARISIRNAKDQVRILPLGLDETTDPAETRWATRRSDVVFSAHETSWGYAPVQQWTGDGEHLVIWAEQRYHRESITPPQIWTADGELVWTGPIACDAALHPTENRLAFVRRNEVHIGWPGEGFEVLDLPGAYSVIEFDPSGRRLAVGGTAKRIGDAEGETPYRSRRDGGATLRVLDGASGELIVESAVGSVGLFGIESWLHRLAWSPDGELIGVSLGKGHNPGVVSATDGSAVLRVQCGHGQMWRTSGVGWAGDRLFHPGWNLERLVPLDDPENPIPIGPCARSECVPLVGSTDVVLLRDEGIARFDPVERRVVWQR